MSENVFPWNPCPPHVGQRRRDAWRPALGGEDVWPDVVRIHCDALPERGRWRATRQKDATNEWFALSLGVLDASVEAIWFHLQGNGPHEMPALPRHAPLRVVSAVRHPTRRIPRLRR